MPFLGLPLRCAGGTADCELKLGSLLGGRDQVQHLDMRRSDGGGQGAVLVGKFCHHAR